jgi:hypothetical protein
VDAAVFEISNQKSMKFSVAAGYQPKNSEISGNNTDFGKFWMEIKPGNDEDFRPETDFRAKRK